MFLVELILVFIIGGFCVIAVAPQFKIFKKAGKASWLSLIPGANMFTFVKITGRPLLFAGGVSILLVLAFFVIRGMIVFQGDFVQYFSAVIMLILVFAGISMIFSFPMLSAFILLSLALLWKSEDIILISCIVGIVIGCLQCVLDVLGWMALLKKMKRPLWQLVFLFLPFIAGAISVGSTVVTGVINITLILAVTIPALLAGFVYYYYIGFSLKIQIKD
jgi:hypothetical protein